jgi:hypothetical protein
MLGMTMKLKIVVFVNNQNPELCIQLLSAKIILKELSKFIIKEVFHYFMRYYT